MIIGAQLYTVRDFAKNLTDFEETLKKIADLGCKTVQVSGTCEYEAEWLNEKLKENGLACVLTHIKASDILENTEKVCRDHGIFGCSNIGLGAVPGGKLNDEIYEKFKADFMPAIEKINKAGYRFFYHNHAFEFSKSADGKRFFEKMLEDFPAEKMSITFDTYWAQFAGADPAKALLSLKGRAQCVHLKDMTVWERNENRMAPVGHGNMDFEAILAAAEQVEAEYLLVEQDNCYGEDPFVCLKKSFDYLKSLGMKF
ncbi:MAG: sugar phosphate isomerase/epimerase [Ruminococcaceae bacterium]|nr:sugar phosphate isomerase/epimerase [Oscillospiraceae bacterium]